jgi:hypothetical protein
MDDRIPVCLLPVAGNVSVRDAPAEEPQPVRIQTMDDPANEPPSPGNISGPVIRITEPSFADPSAGREAGAQMSELTWSKNFT